MRHAVRVSALSACELSGPSSIVAGARCDLARVDDGEPDPQRASAVRHRRGSGGRAPPGAGLVIGTFTADRGRRAGTTACQLSGPSGTAWETHPAGGVLHLRWQVDPARPWAGVSPLQRAADTGSLAGWLDKRLSEEASGPVGSFLPVAKFDADPDADLDAADAADPLAQLRLDIGHARGQTLLVESQMSVADSPASAPRRDYVVQRFGAAPPRDLVELREKVTLDVGAACGIPRALLDASTSGAARESWRQFVATAVDGLCRRLESQIAAQLGVGVAFDSAPLGGRDVLARSAAFRRLAGKEGGLSIADARAAAGNLSITTLTCAACGNTWHPASGASCPACLARGRGRDSDGKLKPDPRWYDPNAARPSGIQASTEALIRRRQSAARHRNRRSYQRRRDARLCEITVCGATG